MKNLLSKLGDYLRYPSTWQGIVSILTAVGVTLKPEQAEAIASAGIALVGVLLAFFSDSDVKQK